MKNITFEKISWCSLQSMTCVWIYSDWREWKRPRILQWMDSFTCHLHLGTPFGADTEVAEDQKIKIPDYKIWELGSSRWRGRKNHWTVEKKHSIYRYFAHIVGKILKKPANQQPPCNGLAAVTVKHRVGSLGREGSPGREGGRWSGPCSFTFNELGHSAVNASRQEAL